MFPSSKFGLANFVLWKTGLRLIDAYVVENGDIHMAHRFPSVGLTLAPSGTKGNQSL